MPAVDLSLFDALNALMSSRQTLSSPASARQDVKKSRFLAFAEAIESEEAAKAFLVRHQDLTASHNCWAWRLGQSYRFNDDGEPSGTAGKPILQAIDGQGLDCVVVLVTRWFGGVLLGSGGLMRAYGGTAALCLRGAEKQPLLDLVSATVACVFSDLALLQARLSALPDVVMQNPDFDGTGARWSLSLPRESAPEMERLVRDLTRGRAQVWFDS
ncbi:uncharacterized protein, YigZ family [Devosia crocina]|uniref:Uncharacterized protein, YigZ family n=2 Tax=Devosia crocina TaxID=429728 RepID=A0A1I7N0M2_9HYPH|nr:uncharacterized protein, YigZ family [Devosia crocina]